MTRLQKKNVIIISQGDISVDKTAIIAVFKTVHENLFVLFPGAMGHP